ncbi:branched-subunit amino acid ABC-type transport system permease component [Paraburkholderia sp. WC7.3g]
MQSFIVTVLNGLSYGLLLFMLSAGLTLIFSMLGVLNFAHASFYMLGAYVGFSVAARAGFWSALVIAPLVVGLLGAALERWLLRRVRGHGHLPELLLTFGAAPICSANSSSSAGGSVRCRHRFRPCSTVHCSRCTARSSRAIARS